jgi:hypothetical protein
MTDSPLEFPGLSPEMLPFDLDPGADTWSFVRLTRDDYDAASFLDERVLGTGAQRRILHWQQVNELLGAPAFSERCQFIFHIGHVGSTLLSRLIGAQPQTFSLREPLILRTLARLATEPPAGLPPWSGAEIEQRLGAGLKLLSRTFDGQYCAVVKATSFVSEAAHMLLTRPSAPRAIMMCVAAESYLATILGGPNSRQEARVLAPQRLRRLQRRIGQISQTAESLSEGEAAALGWACEMAALAEAAKSAGDRALKIDFEHFLAQPAAFLSAVFHHLGIATADTEVISILSGPLMHRYSKAQEHAYDAALRDDVLNEARAAHRSEIRRGLRWLERATEFAAVRDAVAFAGGPAP